MTSAATEVRVLEIVAETFAVDLLELSADTSAQNLAAWTSLAHLRLMANLEREFGVEFTTDDMLAMTSVAAIVGTLGRRR